MAARMTSPMTPSRISTAAMTWGMLPLLALMSLSSAKVTNIPGEFSHITDPSTSAKTGYACEGSTLTIQCPEEMQIMVLRANYGRFSMKICNEGRNTEEWNLQCMSTRALGIVSDKCMEKNYCSVDASNSQFGDTCSSTLKYLEIEYNCTSRVSKSQDISQGNTSSLAPIIGPPHDTSTLSPPHSSTARPSSQGRTPAIALPPWMNPDEPPRAEDFCGSTWARNVSWPKTALGETAVVECPNNRKVRKARWTCGVDRTEKDSKEVDWIKRPDLTQCVSPPVLSIQESLNITSDRFTPRLIERVTEDMVTTTGLGEVIYGGDLTQITSAMQRAVEEIEVHVHEVPGQESPKLLRKVNDAVLKTTSNLLDKHHQESWKDLPQSTQAETATRLIDSVEKSAFQVARSIEKPTIIINITVNVVVEIRVINITATETPPDISFSPKRKQYNSGKGKPTDKPKPYPTEKVKSYPTDKPYPTPSSTSRINLDQDGKSHNEEGRSEGGSYVYGDDGTRYGKDRSDQKPTDQEDFEMTFENDQEYHGEVGWWDGHEAQQPGGSNYLDTTWNECGDSITLTGSTIKQLGMDGLVKVVFATYENLDQWMQPSYVNVGYGADGLPELHVQHQQMITTRPQLDHIQEQKGREPVTVGPLQRDSESEESGASSDDKDEQLKDKVVATRIISAAVNGRQPGKVKLKEPIIYTLEHRTKEEIYNPSCSFWEYSEKTMNGKWSTFGCELVETNTTHTSCACEHLTNFAVLMSVTDNQISKTNEFALALLTYFGGIPSILCLIAAFVTFHCFKNLQCDRNTIHKNLVLMLCIAEVVFLCGIAQYRLPILCRGIAVVLHYLFLAAFAWMCVEGVQLYFMLVEVFESERSRVRWYYAAAYGLPAIVVIVSAAVNINGYGTIDQYGKMKYCWLSTENGFIWAFVGPVSAIICVNMIMLSIAIFVMCRHANNAANQWKMKQKTQLENIRTWIMGAVVLVVLLGLTWIFGLFFMSERSVVMAYVFTALNIFQGLFIFVFHCLMNDKVQKEYKKWVRHNNWLPENFRIWYGGAKASSSTTPNNSSSSGVNKILREQKLSFEYLTRLLSNRRRKRSSTTTLASSSTPGRYNAMQRHSDSTTVPGRDSALTDRLSAEPPDSEFGAGADSHIYSEPTEDPCAYLEPVRIRLDPDEEMYMGGGEMSTMEGSVADTDYMDNLTKRGGVGGSRAGPRGAQRAASPPTINIDKYKIRSPVDKPESSTSRKPPIYESDYSDGELFDKLVPPAESTNSYSPDPSATNQFLSEDSLIRRKLLPSDEDEIPASLGARAQNPPSVNPAAQRSQFQPKRGEVMAGVARPPGGQPPPLPQRINWNQRPDGTE